MEDDCRIDRKTKTAILRKTSMQQNDPETPKRKGKKVNENMEGMERWSEKEHVLEGGRWVGVTQARESNL